MRLTLQKCRPLSSRGKLEASPSLETTEKLWISVAVRERNFAPGRVG